MNRIRINRIKEKVFMGVGIFSTLIGILLLAFFIGDIVRVGWDRIDFDFLSSLPSRKPEKSGIYTAMMGTVWVLVLTAIISFPIRVAAGIYLEKYTKNGRLYKLQEINISNLSGEPSIIYGLLGLELFVRFMKAGNSVIAGRLT
jgi:phosphate transport system permease protein